MASFLPYVLTEVQDRNDKRNVFHTFLNSTNQHVTIYLPKSLSEDKLSKASHKVIPKAFIMLKQEDSSQ